LLPTTRLLPPRSFSLFAVLPHLNYFVVPLVLDHDLSEPSTGPLPSSSLALALHLALRTCPPVPLEGDSPPPSPLADFWQPYDSMAASPLTTPRPSISQPSSDRRDSSGKGTNDHYSSSTPPASSPALGLPTALKPIGIVNEQNTCFLNSTFQAVSTAGTKRCDQPELPVDSSYARPVRSSR